MISSRDEISRVNTLLEVKATFRLQKPHCKNFWWKHIKNVSTKCYLGNKEQKAVFLVVPRSDVHFDFGTCAPEKSGI